MSDPDRAGDVPMLKHSGKKGSSSKTRKNPLLEEKTHLTRMLYLLGKEKGHRHGYLSQPAVMKKLFHPLVKDPKILRRTDADIKQAVKMWCNPDTHEQAEDKYGDIRYWDTSDVTDMKGLFWTKRHFNDDISAWNVRKVITMNSMFADATSFNGDISAWDVGNVTDMKGMFFEARSFNGDISAWDVRNVTKMNRMFNEATLFNSDISAWDVRNVTDMSLMFWGATSFNIDISKWNVQNVTKMNGMFLDCPILDRNKPPKMRGGGARKTRRRIYKATRKGRSTRKRWSQRRRAKTSTQTRRR